MALTLNRLSTAKVRALSKPGLHADGGCLFLQVATVGGSKSWVFRFSKDGKTKALGLGAVHAVSLAAARDKAAGYRAMMAEGKDPTPATPKVAAPTFDQCAEQYIATHSKAWSNAKHVAQWGSTLTTYAGPIIGAMPVCDITTEHVLHVLKPIWTTKTETASRVQGRIESVLGWATAMKHRTGDNPAAWRNHLEHLLASPAELKKVQHRPALAWQQLPAFMQALGKQPGDAAKALKLLILTATRSGEVRGATWSEIDLEGAVWTIPADRMKAKVEHAIPLNDAALALLRELPRHVGTDLIFPSRAMSPLSDMTLTALIRRMNNPAAVWVDAQGLPIVVHGFRSTFRMWAAEQTAYAREVAEHALAHRLPDKVEAAYQRSTLFVQRRAMMADWGGWVVSGK